MSHDPWWKSAVVYQVYPRSFQDSNGDGVGDLAGIGQRLDYLAWLGVDAVWLSPICPSPMADFGYDVADYCDVDPLFGDLPTFDALVAGLHERGLKLILDFVPNHSSDRHPWFVEARSGRGSRHRDWYIWRDPAPGGGPPNNWQSQAGGPAWTFDEASGQYYYHAFLPQQPDLNWRNPELREAMLDAMRFWLARGVDGFRVDVIWHMAKDPELKDDPVNPDYRPGDPPFRQVVAVNSADHHDVHEIVAEMRKVTEGYPGDRVLIGEIYLPLERLVAYYGVDLSGAHLPFNFQLIGVAWDARVIADLIEAYEAALPPGGWGNWVLGNHDQPRIASRVGRLQAAVAATLLLTLRGTPTLYYGDELGLENSIVPPERERDPFGLRMPGTGQGRDPQRAPMPWDDGPAAGFTMGEPWLPLAQDWRERNVAHASADPHSMLSLTRALLALRKRRPSLTLGTFAIIQAADDVLAYERRLGEERTIIVLNLRDEPRQLFDLAEAGTILLSTVAGREVHVGQGPLALRPGEGLVLELAPG